MQTTMVRVFLTVNYFVKVFFNFISYHYRSLMFFAKSDHFLISFLFVTADGCVDRGCSGCVSDRNLCAFPLSQIQTS